VGKLLHGGNQRSVAGSHEDNALRLIKLDRLQVRSHVRSYVPHNDAVPAILRYKRFPLHVDGAITCDKEFTDYVIHRSM
jgi:hypothetical protein